MPSTWYTWRVRAYDGSGAVRWSDGDGRHFQNPALPTLPALQAVADGDGIEISWSSPGASAEVYRIFRRESDGSRDALPVDGAGTGWAQVSPDLRAIEGSVRFLDLEAEPGILYVYAIKTTDTFGASQWWGPVTAGLPAIKALSCQVLPNPGIEPRLALALPRSGDVSVRLFDIGGREILREDWPHLRAGLYNRPLDLERAGAAALPAGTYWVRVNTVSGTRVVRWTLVR
jgi:hypothetical protein